MKNIKFILLLSSLLAFIPIVKAQQMQGKVFRPSWLKDRNGIQIVDLANIRIWYALNAEDIKNPSSYIDLQRLEIGEKLSKYYSFFVSNSDSLCADWIIKNPQAQSIPRKFGITGKFPDYWSEYQFSVYFKKHETNQFTEYARMPYSLKRYNSQYSEEIPKQDWTILSDTLTINKYLCQKATCHFRGRSYIAWFTMDIPISNGPWKFGGLPGLILKIYDTNNLYTFECVKIEKGKFPIEKHDYSNYKTINRLKLLKYQKDINENFKKVAGVISRNNKKVQYVSVSYEPLELE